jgi:hypothetical protein
MVIEAVKEMKKQVGGGKNLTFWILKMTMKMQNTFNNLPLRLKSPDVQQFDFSFG